MPAIGSNKGHISQGIIYNSCGEWDFKEGFTKTVVLSSGRSKGKTSVETEGIKLKGGSKKSTKKSSKGKNSAVGALVTVGSGKASRGKKSTQNKGQTSPG